MTYKVMNKTPKNSNGQIVSTTIDIRQDEPYTIISRTFNEDLTNAEDSAAIERVLEVVNEETTPKSELKRNIKDLEEELERTQAVVDEQKTLIDKQVESNGLLASAFEELSIVVFDSLDAAPDVEETPVEEEPTEEVSQ